MIPRLFFLMLAAMVFVAGAAGQSVPDASVPSNDEIRHILVERIDDFHQSVGIVVGVIEPSGRRIVSYGTFGKEDRRPVDGETVYEIGSITKVFTSLLLADMVQRGEVSLKDPVAKYLPPEVKVPEYGGHIIVLEDLSTHTSGLPRMPSNFAPKDPANPYADYTVEQLYEFLSGYTLTRDIGVQFEYSNLGAGLLGHALALRAGTDYETLVRTRILAPLKMSNTGIVFTPEMKARLAQGYNGALEPVKNWDLPTLAGAGALRSNLNDMLNFLAANLGYMESPLAPAMAAMLKVRRPINPAEVGITMENAMAWLVQTRGQVQIAWHNGGTGGYRTFAGYDPKRRVGVVVLSNAGTARGVDDIGLHLLYTTLPLMPPPKERKEITVDPNIFNRYVGRYELTPALIFVVTREGDRLFVRLAEQSKLEAFAESERDFFYKDVDAQVTFEVNGEGRATGLVLHQNGRDYHAARIE